MRGETFPKLKKHKHPEGKRLVTSPPQDTLTGCNSPASHIYALGKLKYRQTSTIRPTTPQLPSNLLTKLAQRSSLAVTVHATLWPRTSQPKSLCLTRTGTVARCAPSIVGKSTTSNPIHCWMWPQKKLTHRGSGSHSVPRKLVIFWSQCSELTKK